MSQFDDDFWSDGSESTGEADLAGGFAKNTRWNKMRMLKKLNGVF